MTNCHSTTPLPSIVLMQQTLDPARLTLLGVSLLATGFLYTVHRARQKKSCLPPGPPPDPILGNVRQFPKTEWHNTFMVWQEQYGLNIPSVSHRHALTAPCVRRHRPCRPHGPTPRRSQPTRRCGGIMVQAGSELLEPLQATLCDGNVRTAACRWSFGC